MATWPNFLQIGMAKTGTTSLHEYLGQHPEIFTTELKEPGFFVFEGQADINDDREGWKPYIRDIDAYHALFADVRGEKAIGESTAAYIELVTPAVIERMRRYVPDVRLIANFRHPVDHAFSYYVMRSRGRVVSIDDFAAVLRRDFDRADPLGVRWGLDETHYARSYASRIELYLKAFDRGRIRLGLYDDFNADPQAYVSDLFGFLEVDEGFRVDMSQQLNPGRVLRSSALRSITHKDNPIRTLARKIIPAGMRKRASRKLIEANLRPAPKLDAELRRELSLGFGDEIHRLEEILDRDLSHWLA